MYICRSKSYEKRQVLRLCHTTDASNTPQEIPEITKYRNI